MSTKHGPCAFCVTDEYGHVCTGACDKLTVVPTRTEFEAAALPPLPDHIGEIVGRRGEPDRTLEFWGYFNEASAEGRERKERVFTADQMREYARTAIAAAMGWPTVPPAPTPKEPT